jgi:hypothetical protein
MYRAPIASKDHNSLASFTLSIIHRVSHLVIHSAKLQQFPPTFRYIQHIHQSVIMICNNGRRLCCIRPPHLSWRLLFTSSNTSPPSSVVCSHNINIYICFMFVRLLVIFLETFSTGHNMIVLIHTRAPTRIFIPYYQHNLSHSIAIKFA